MKKFRLLLPLLFFIIFPTAYISAQSSTPSAAASPTPTQSGPTPMQSHYTLPYPGLLPNNPLYMVKVIRDDIIAFFISDPAKKSAFYLLESDKRLAASRYLLQAGNTQTSLAATTLAKSTNYFAKALEQASLAQKTGESTTALVGQLHDSLQKHEMVVANIVQQAGMEKSLFAQEQARLHDFEKPVLQLSQNQ